MTGNLQGKIVLVTAAAQGIGHASALAFASAGATVHAVDINEVQVKKLESESTGIVAHKLDVLDEAAINALVEEIGIIDVLFNCAGITQSDTVLTLDMDTLDFTFDLNVKSMVRTIRAVLPGMTSRGEGSIINMASIASCEKGMQDLFSFSTTKAAVIGLTKSIAADYVSRGIRCNAICPGLIDTPSFKARLKTTSDHDAALEEFTSNHPMGRLGTAEEVADLVVHVASATYITGQAYNIDGGLTI